ncbi:MAG: phosphoribosyltransferase [Candidatus Saccharibacteria bacterium]|nr:phosphoribosyltransferase [Candidatus Saccharibacteria bacterium]
MLAARLAPTYQGKPCAVVALSDGGAVVGAQIASQLHCVLTLLLTEKVSLPNEPVAVGGVLSTGAFAYNSAYSAGELEEINSEYHGVIEQEKFTKFRKLNALVGSSETIDRNLLEGRNVILVSDAFEGTFPIDMAMEFMKPIPSTRVVVATPLSDVVAIDRMHISADEICCLSVVENLMEADHYYDKNDVPEHQHIIDTIEQIMQHWNGAKTI